MSNATACRCQSCTIRHMTGAAVVITIGILLLLQQAHRGNLGLENTWPAILLVLGAIQLASAFAPRDGHIEAAPPAAIPPATPPPPIASQSNSPSQGL
jgi:hypothetical protein